MRLLKQLFLILLPLFFFGVSYSETIAKGDLLFNSKFCTTKKAPCNNNENQNMNGKVSAITETVGSLGQAGIAAKVREKLISNGVDNLKQISAVRNFIVNDDKATKKIRNKLSKKLRKSCGANTATKILNDSKNANLAIQFKDSNSEQLYKKDLKRRYGLAAATLKRINRSLQPGWVFITDEERERLKERKNKILKTYPMAKLIHFSFSQYTKYYNLEELDGFERSDLMDTLLFPDQKTGQYVEIKDSKNSDRNDKFAIQLAKKVFNSELPKAVEKRVNLGINNWYGKVLNSYSKLCKADDCGLLDIDHNTTRDLLNELPSSQRSFTGKEICSCKLGIKNQTVSGRTMAAGAVLSVGSALACFLFPPSSPAACPLMAASTAGLAAGSGVNAYGAIQDSMKSGRQVLITKYLPGLPESVRKRHQSDLVYASGRVLGNTVGAVAGAGVITRGAQNTVAAVRHIAAPLNRISIGNKTRSLSTNSIANGQLADDSLSVGIEVEALMTKGVTRKIVAQNVKKSIEDAIGSSIEGLQITSNPLKGLVGYDVKYIKDGKEHVWQVIGDPSLRSSGVEIVSPVLKGLDDKKLYNQVISKLSGKGLIKSDPVFGGVHVHVGATNMSASQASRLATEYAKIDKAAKSSFSSHGYRVDKFAKEHPEKFLEQTKNNVYKTTESLAKASAEDKRTALNLRRLLEEPSARTVEYRFFNSSVDVDAIESMVRFSEKFTTAVKQNDTRLLNAVSQSGSFNIDKLNKALDLGLNNQQLKAVKQMSQEAKDAVSNLGSVDNYIQQNKGTIGLSLIVLSEIGSAALFLGD